MSENLTVKNLLLKISICLVILLIVMVICIFIGPEMSRRVKAVLGIGSHSLTKTDIQILFQVRLSRIILAAIVGAALACSGVTLQAILRNPLADPYILGISSGAALGVIIALTCGVSFNLWFGSSISIFAFVGTIGTVWLVWSIGRFATAGSSITALLLAGVVVNAFFSAVIMFLTSIAKSYELRFIAFWLMGNLADKGKPVLIISSVCIVTGIIVIFSIAQKLNVLTLGRAEAKALGISTANIRLIGFAVSAFITAVAVSLTGLIGFVGLIVPHGVRLIFGPDHRQLVPMSALIGAIFLIIADTTARSVFSGSEQPVGVITAITGGPFFLILLAKYSRKISWAK